MIASERKRYIMQQLNEKGIINLKEIAKELEISEVTARRDFEKLEKEGKLKRVLGGATLDENQEPSADGAELTMKEKKMLHKKEKQRIAEFAAKYVKDDDSVFLDAGTSMVPLMRILEKRKIKIVTYNELLINSTSNPVAEIFVIGGQHRPYYSMNVGPVAQDVLKQFYFNKAFFGCSGVDLSQRMVYTTEMESLLMKRIALENSDASYLLVDHSKIGRRNYLKLSEISAFTQVICDSAEGESVGEVPENMIFV